MTLENLDLDRSIFLFGEVWAQPAEKIIKQLLDMNSKSSHMPINMFINSPGGNCMDMFAIVDAMNNIDAPINTYVLGIAASAAAIIAVNGDKRYITENSKIMIHKCWTILGGNVDQIKEDVKQMEDIDEKMFKILAEKTGKKYDDVVEFVGKKDNWLDPDAAFENGIIDEILSSEDEKVLKFSEGFDIDGASIEDELKPIHLLQEGEYKNTKYGTLTITDEMLLQVKENFDKNVRGQEISIDYTHENDNGEKKAAAWVKEVYIEDKGLYAKVEYTPIAAELVKNKEYKYVSPEIAISYNSADGKSYLFVLIGGTLTNRPVMKGLKTLKFSENINNKFENMSIAEIKLSLKNQHNIDLDSLLNIQSQIAKSGLSFDDLLASGNKLKEVQAKVSQLETEKENILQEKNKIEEAKLKSDKEQFVDKLIESGIVANAQKERVINNFKSVAEIEDFYKGVPASFKVKAIGSGTTDITTDPAELKKLAEETGVAVEDLKNPKYNTTLTK